MKNGSRTRAGRRGGRRKPLAARSGVEWYRCGGWRFEGGRGRLARSCVCGRHYLPMKKERWRWKPWHGGVGIEGRPYWTMVKRAGLASLYLISAAFESTSCSLFLAASWTGRHPLTTRPRSLPPLRSALRRPSRHLRRAGHEVVVWQRGAAWDCPLSSSCSRFSLMDLHRPCLPEEQDVR